MRLTVENGEVVDDETCRHDWTEYVAVDTTTRRVRVCDDCGAVERV